MGKVTIKYYTTSMPITMIGEFAGECYGANTTDSLKNYMRGIECLKNNHGRTLEFPQVYLSLEGYSARVMREFYTHIGGMPSRLQSSTRYIDYKNLDYIVPPSIDTKEKQDIYNDVFNKVQVAYRELEKLGVPNEDISNILPLGMTTKVVTRTNLRNLIDMSHQRLCKRTYWEYRELMYDLMDALANYSPEWSYIVDHYFVPKCEVNDICKCLEGKGCGRYGK